MNNEPLAHLWIPDEETHRITKDLTARPKQRNISYREHGSKLSHSLQQIKGDIEKMGANNSLMDSGIIVFDVELPKGDRVQDKEEMFASNGMKINAVRDVSNAIVTINPFQYQKLNERIDNYTKNGAYRTSFESVESFKPYSGNIKDSNGIKKSVAMEKPPVTIDVQLMLIPNLDRTIYQSAIEKITQKTGETQGKIESVYYLSDETPVIRAIIPSGTLSGYEDDPAVYRIEETSFFTIDADPNETVDLADLILNPYVNINELPVVAILDSGVSFPHNLSSIITGHWSPKSSPTGDTAHGTKVAGNVAFRYLNQNINGNVITPRVRIIDCNILTGSVPQDILLQRIREAVETFGSTAKIFNLSANANGMPIEGDKMSILGSELDTMQFKYGIQFVISAGNHNLWQYEDSLANILNDDDTQISSPADSMLSIVVGSVIGENHHGSLSQKDEIAPYSRRGPGFIGFSKPDISAYAGTVIHTNGNTVVPQDDYSLVLSKDGHLEPDIGTSFSAPIIAGDIAVIGSFLPDNDLLLAKALLYQEAKPLWDTDTSNDDELAGLHNLYGRGISNLEYSKFSSTSRVTLLRTGSLNRKTKERVSIFMPPILAAQKGRNTARVTVNCVSLPSVDHTKGSEYLGAFIRFSLKKAGETPEKLIPVSPEYKEGRQKWDTCQQYSREFSYFNSGDWQIWLELFGRWSQKNIDVKYALVVTIEDLSGNLDIYTPIRNTGRYRSLNEIRVKV
jgi:subtilisin family serine protease